MHENTKREGFIWFFPANSEYTYVVAQGDLNKVYKEFKKIARKKKCTQIGYTLRCKDGIYQLAEKW